MIRCDKCAGATKEKQITSKKNGQQYTMLECTNGCKDGRWPHSFFPPKEEKQIVQKPSNGNGFSGVEYLKSIDATLKRIEKILANPNRINIAQSEMQPDEQVPF